MLLKHPKLLLMKVCESVQRKKNALEIISAEQFTLKSLAAGYISG